MRHGVHRILIAACLVACGCESTAERHANQAVVAYYYADYDRARVLLDPLAKNPDENFVLNNARLGSTTLAGCRSQDAEDAFLRAYEVINSVGVNNGGRSLGAVLIDEKIKIWKGEPFERAMVNYYLGLVYYTQHDYGNARAAFENALFKLRDYGPGDKNGDKYQEVESNFALAYLMLGKSWQRLGELDKAQQMFDRVAKLRPDLASLADAQLNQNANLLLAVDWGYGPEKRTDADGSIVGFGPDPNAAGPIRLPRVFVDGRLMPTGEIQPPVDLLALAQDRQWESIDTIRLVKSVAGTGLMAAGAVVGLNSRNAGSAETGLALFLAGLFLKATSQADIRQWEMLPRTAFVIPLQVSPGKHDITVEFGHEFRQTWQGLIAPEKGDNTYYMRMSMWTSGPFTWPPPPTGFSPGTQNYRQISQ